MFDNQYIFIILLEIKKRENRTMSLTVVGLLEPNWNILNDGSGKDLENCTTPPYNYAMSNLL